MPLPDPAVWRDMLSYLRRHHGEICRQWFEDLEPLRLANGVLEVRAANEIQRNYLARRCGDQFREAAQNATGALVSVAFVDDALLESEAIEPLEAPAVAVAVERAVVPALPRTETRSITPPPGQRISRPVVSRPTDGFDDDQIVLSPDYCFENFVTGPGNRLAYAASVAVAEQPGQAYNPLFIHGGVGLGKTHLLQAICQTVLGVRPETRICYLSCDSFMNQFLESVQKGEMHTFRHRYRHVDILVIDDIHFLTKRERSQEEFFHTFNTLYQANKQIVLSSDSPPNEIPQLEERLVSRFNWGLVARIDRPCYETRVAIVKRKAQVRGIAMPDDAVCFIASKIDSNTRELEGAITRVQSLAMLRGVAIDLTLTQQALGDETPQTQPQLTIQNIIDAVTSYFGVKLADLQSKRRHRSITQPRQICMYLARKYTRYSLEEIGGYFGGRDHTTVLHAIRTTEGRMAGDDLFASQVAQLEAKLQG